MATACSQNTKVEASLGYAINGLYLTQNNLGTTRFASELIAELDKLVNPGELVVVAPETCEASPYENIQLVKCGKRRGIAWEQLDFPRFLKKNHLKSINLANTLPLLHPQGITAIHDVCYKVKPEFYKGLRNRLSRLWHMLNYRVALDKCEKIITVSEFSKSEMVRVYGKDPSKISVIYNAWQHMERVKADARIIESLGLVLMSTQNSATISRQKPATFLYCF